MSLSLKHQVSAYYPQIDGLRFLGFLFVFLNHFNLYSPLSFLRKMGWTGVYLFFIISSFLLTRILVVEYHSNNKIDFQKYFIRRVLRIWPLYFSYLLLILLASLTFNKEISVYRFLGNVFFLDNFLAESDGRNPNFASGHLWTISLEEQFYLILPFLLVLYFKLKNYRSFFFGILVLTVFVVFSLPFLTGSGLDANFRRPASWIFLLIGFLLGLGYGQHLTKKIHPYIAIVLSFIFIIVSQTLFVNRGTLFMNTAVIICIALSFLFLLSAVFYDKSNVIYRFFTVNAIRYLGKISYGLYIFHLLAIAATRDVFEYLPESIFFLSFFFALSINILIAAFTYEFFEKRFLKLKEKFSAFQSNYIPFS